MKHKKILKFIQVHRDSFADATLIYKWGGCYGFFKIMKHQYPEAIAFFADEENDHILTKIGGKFYDIDGEYQYETNKASRLKPIHHERWSAKVKTQRVEFMIAKYNRMVKRHANNE